MRGGRKEKKAEKIFSFASIRLRLYADCGLSRLIIEVPRSWETSIRPIRLTVYTINEDLEYHGIGFLPLPCLMSVKHGIGSWVAGFRGISSFGMESLRRNHKPYVQYLLARSQLARPR
ncbi:uncharacterized protein FOMMEDRAFT_154213 [Fomitiporia mediterranea MF3/22]|uniref:uncharacterized protein n=1 Tax=Fomitiporia mediterranea (strain MF3/22) TaxID=694068 RepID=UPI0004407787|nr:uncharacterized protein FOMMEDRAFT_154213 [Fomitiporia mediterranea MF3/22]EJD05046.1 hypothetical protein FOMMEDRAFT_154213 [Fomitiporia mediterranea MF3/22]